MKKKKPVKKRASLPPMALSLEGTQASRTGSWRYLKPVYLDKLAPCNETCPAGEDVEAAIFLAGQEDYLGAWEKIVQENPLPRVCGRVCFHPCEESCNRREFDEPASINALERFLGDYAFQSGRRLASPKERRREKVAIIGSGPAGLSCAYQLARLGYQVTIFEAQPEPGGMLRYGIPAYRLPKAVLKEEIDGILALGIKVRTATRVGKDVGWDEVKRFDAVFLASGAWKSLPLQIPGEDGAGVISGLEFLRRVNSGEPVELGNRVAVIGGGNTAMDAARSALRLGAKVMVIYRRSEEEMPAWREEVTEAKEEGVEFIFLSSPVRILAENGRVNGIECIKNLLGPAGKDGRREPRPIAGSTFTLTVSSVISAIGETPDFSFLPAEFQNAEGSLPVADTGATSIAKVFAGGDLLAHPRTVPYAIGSGKRAAVAINATLSGKDAAAALRRVVQGNKGGISMALYDKTGGDGPARQVVSFAELNKAYFKRQGRGSAQKISPADRTSGFPEVTVTLSPESALKEAKRCFNCGVCNLCHNCFLYCPDMAVSARPDKMGYEINYDYCKGCCVCVEECPRGALSVEVKR